MFCRFLAAPSLLLAFLGASVPPAVAAQDLVTDGTAPGAPTTLVVTGETASWLSQTFMPRGPILRSLSLWHYGGIQGSGDDLFSRLYINEGVGFQTGSSLLIQEIDHRRQGRYDFVFDPIEVMPGLVYTFSVFTNNCGRDCFSDLSTPPGDFHRLPTLEVTTINAYDDGYFMVRNGPPDPSRDIRFEATFEAQDPTVVPEPEVVVLLASGLLALGILARRPS